MTFNAKNLNYESKEPSFLRKLKSEMMGGGSSRQHRTPQPIPKRNREPDDEDEPVFVDENNNALSKAQYDALVKSTEEPQETEQVDRDDSWPAQKLTSEDKPANRPSVETENSLRQQPSNQSVSIGGKKKKSKAKVLANGSEDEADSHTNSKLNTAATSPIGGIKKRQKRRKINLSFEDGL